MSPVVPNRSSYAAVHRVRFDYIFLLDPNGDPHRVAYPIPVDPLVRWR